MGDSVQDKVIADIVAAREAANQKGNGNNDLVHSGNDWIAFVTAYLGRAARGVYRNEKEGQSYRDNLVKAGGLIISALVAYDRRVSQISPAQALALAEVKPETVAGLATE